MLVAGFSGIGKTAVVHEVHKPIVKQRGYFILGKFDQFNRNIPFSAFVQAFRDLMGQLLSESDAQLQVWKTQILNAVRDNGQVIIEVIPELERIIGSQPTATELSGSASQNRFNLLFQKFIKVFTTKEHPLVMFLDDLQWADSASLNLMQLLMLGSETGYLLLIGAYRDNEVSPAHPLMLALDTIGKAGATIDTITLKPLSQTSLNHLVADTLSCGGKLAQPLTDLVYQKTQGNPFFATQFLKALHQDGLISFTPPTPPYQGGATGGWQCDLVRVRLAALTDDVVEFMALQLQKLPAETQEVLKLAACVGNQFDLNTLAIVSEQSEIETATALWRGLQEGLILPITETYKFYVGSKIEHDVEQNSQVVNYKFLHDRVQQAADSLIPDDQKQATHLQIGQLLFQDASSTTLEERLFDIVNHLNVGKSLIDRPSERTELAKLNLAAGRKAKLATAYSAAIDYCTTGMNLLEEDSWRSNYELTLALQVAAAEFAYLSGQFEQLDAIATVTLKSAKTLLDKIATYETLIQAYQAQNRLAESIQTALNVLSQLNIQLPPTPNMAQIFLGLGKNKLILAGKKTSNLLNLPTMSNPEKLAAMRILSSAASTAFIGAPKLFPLLAFQQVNLSVQYGNTPLSAYAYAYYGIILCGVLVDIDGGYEFGQLALEILEKFNAKDLRSKVVFVANCFIFHWKDHLKSTLSGLQEAYQVGLEIGDLEYAGWAAAILGSHLYWSGHELSELAQTLHHYGEAVKQSKQHNPLVLTNIYRQAVMNLLGESPNPSVLDGWAYSAAQNAMQEAAGDRTGVFFYYVNQICLSYLFGEFSNAVKQATVAKQSEEGGTSVGISLLFNLYDSLARLALYSTASVPEQSQILRRITQNQKKLQKWAGFAPMNSLHKFHLVEAERYRVLGKSTQALEMYDRAISGAQANEYINEEALANELAAKFYLDWGKEKVAAGYMQEAYYCYAKWGAKAKVEDLEQRYPQLLAPILRSQQIGYSLHNLRLETINKAAIIHQTIPTTISKNSSSSVSQALDFATILKASQSISSEIKIEQIMASLIQVIMENSGAKKAALLRYKENNLTVELLATKDETFTQLSIPVEESQALPIGLVNYVKRTLKAVILDDATAQNSFINDPYFLEKQPKSVLCTPILHQGKLIGSLYLENNLTVGAFTLDNLEVVQLLCGQAAISMENASLYVNEQEKNQQLQRTIEELQQSELRFKQLFNKSADAILLLSDLGFIDCNQAAVKLFGYSCPEELCAIEPSQISPEFQADGQSSLDKANATIAIALNNGSHQFEWLHQRSSGEIFWAEVTLTLIPYEKEQILHSLVRDISDRKAVEREQQKLLTIINATPDIVGIADAEGNTLFLNPAGQKLLNIPAEEQNQFNIATVTAASSQESLLTEALPAAIREGIWSGELVLLSRNGREFPVSQTIVAHKDEQGQVEYFSTIMRDISEQQAVQRERKQVTEELEKFERKLTFLIQSTPIGVIEWNPDFKVVGWNPAAEKIFGYRVEEMLGHHALQIVPEAYQAYVVELMQALLTQQGGTYSLNDNITKDGRTIVCEWINTSLLDEEGNSMGIYSMVQDITDRKNAETAIQQKSQELEQALQELQQAQLQIVQSEKMSALGNLVAGVAHEINNPVGCIIGNVGAVQDSINDLFGLIDLYGEELPQPSAKIEDELEAIDLEYLREDLPKLIKAMKNGGDRITSISKSLRTFSRADSDKKQKFNLHEGIDSTLLILRHRLKANDTRPAIEVVTNYGNIPAINCFPGQLNQVFMNLLANAIDAVEESNQGRSFAQIQAHPNQIAIQTTVEGEGVKIAISDNGKGMPDEVKTRIFDHLFTTKGVGKGTGLGLAIARQIVVEKHGGAIEVNSTVGTGTEFVLELPVFETILRAES